MGKMRLLTRLLVAGVGAGALALPAAVLLAAPASAATATGCSGSATSMDRNGATLGEASAPGSGATESDPLKIDSHGSVSYQGSTDDVIQHGKWDVKMDTGFGFNVDVASGKITNDSGTKSTSGVAEVHKYLVLGGITIATGEYHVHFTATGEGGASCTADVYIDIQDSPLKTPIFYVALVLIVLAFLMLLFFGRPEAMFDILEGDFEAAADEIFGGGS